MTDIEFPLLICGLPASGKSTLASKLAGNGRSVLEWDAFVKQFGSPEELAEEKAIAIRMFRERMRHLHPDIVVDVFQSRDDRLKAVDAYNGRLNAAIVQCSLETCLKRNAIRKGSLLKNDELRRIAYSFEPILPNEGFKHIYIIDGEGGEC